MDYLFVFLIFTVILSILNIFDAVTTLILKYKQKEAFKEGNLIVRKLLKYPLLFIIFKILLIGIVILEYILIAITITHYPFFIIIGMVVFIAQIVIYSFVVLHNLNIIIRRN